MADTLKAQFDTRRDAELAVERLVQEYGVERTDIFVAPKGDENSAGVRASGADEKAGAPSVEARDDGALTGRVE
ncbi:hypothetical protein LTR94_026168, partial [Friedmanniomyces endolithicus]